MGNEPLTRDQLLSEIADLRARLEVAEDTVAAIRNGHVDALVVADGEADRIFTLANSDRFYRLLVDAMQQGAATLSADGTILYSNARFAELTGVALAAVRGENFRAFVAPDTRPEWEALLAAGLRADSQQELTLSAGGGRTYPAHVAVTPLPLPGAAVVSVMVTDLTAQKRHAEVVAAEALGRSILDQAVDVVAVCDRDWTVIRASQGAYRMCAAPPLGRGFAAAFPLTYGGCDEDGCPVAFDAVAAGETLRGVEVCLRAAEPRDMLLSASPLRDAAGGVLGYVVTLTDISERKRVELALKDADRRKDEFLAMLAHELRNPLAPIRNALQIIRLLADSNPNVVWARDVAERQVAHLTRLVDDLLDVSRITRGKIKLQPERLDLAGVVTRAVETVRPQAQARGHTLTVQAPQDQMWVDGDATRLEQVLNNLLNNAVKYTEPGGRIDVTATRDGEARVAVRVRDSGAGIPAEMLPKVFDLFTQIDRTLERSQGGLGVGLTLVRRLVEMHGGEVEARSDGPGRGSEFVVRLPLALEGGVV